MSFVSNATLQPVNADDLDQHLTASMRLSTNELTKQLHRCTSEWCDGWRGTNADL